MVTKGDLNYQLVGLTITTQDGNILLSYLYHLQLLG